MQLLVFVINHVAPDVNKQASHKSSQTYLDLGAVFTGATCCVKVLRCVSIDRCKSIVLNLLELARSTPFSKTFLEPRFIFEIVFYITSQSAAQYLSWFFGQNELHEIMDLNAGNIERFKIGL